MVLGFFRPIVGTCAMAFFIIVPIQNQNSRNMAKFLSPIPERDIIRPKMFDSLKAAILNYLPKFRKDEEEFISPLAEAISQPSPSPIPSPLPSPSPTPQPFYLTIKPMVDIPQDLLKQPFVEYIAKKFPDQVNEAVSVAFLESSLYPKKVGGLGERGLFQILPSTFYGESKQPYYPEEFKDWTYEDLFDPYKNIDWAAWLYSRYGWKPWVAARNLKLVK